jgi:hypothetical protein
MRTVDAGTFWDVPVLGRNGWLESAKTRSKSETKLLWNEGAIWNGEGFGGSDGKKRLTSCSFAKCSRGRLDHLIPPASEDVDRRLAGSCDRSSHS